MYVKNLIRIVFKVFGLTLHREQGLLTTQKEKKSAMVEEKWNIRLNYFQTSQVGVHITNIIQGSFVIFYFCLHFE